MSNKFENTENQEQPKDSFVEVGGKKEVSSDRIHGALEAPVLGTTAHKERVDLLKEFDPKIKRMELKVKMLDKIPFKGRDLARKSLLKDLVGLISEFRPKMDAIDFTGAHADSIIRSDENIELANLKTQEFESILNSLFDSLGMNKDNEEEFANKYLSAEERAILQKE